MSITGISSVPSPLATLQSAKAEVAKAPNQQGPGFSERMENAVEDLKSVQETARSSATAFETGATNDLATVMVDQQVASLSLQLALNIRNKALGAYRDIMNMPV